MKKCKIIIIICVVILSVSVAIGLILSPKNPFVALWNLPILMWIFILLLSLSGVAALLSQKERGWAKASGLIISSFLGVWMALYFSGYIEEVKEREFYTNLLKFVNSEMASNFKDISIIQSMFEEKTDKDKRPTMRLSNIAIENALINKKLNKYIDTFSMMLLINIHHNIETANNTLDVMMRMSPEFYDKNKATLKGKLKQIYTGMAKFQQNTRYIAQEVKSELTKEQLEFLKKINAKPEFFLDEK